MINGTKENEGKSKSQPPLEGDEEEVKKGKN